ncbi:class II glutamine amidotransferase [Shimia sp. R9_1]|uniref:class II glutamine amidotransferase n=1 Tax=unclassified Shimia TaxID=2630038 RepID=UPI001ADA961A|nr:MULTISPECIES: class II glutamine amidotransferase [unclassified Shimia]MBO9397143.1 class II glutamine amidotransferase [Shimia sp. R9_2]MBO9408376.1 class II glutamine amidotransferase [Shimia sp. R9_1]
MCRWAAYIGHPCYLEDLVTRPDHSLIQQSMQATECKTQTNGDGVGLAWYGSRPEPGLYRDTHPAWSDPNLRSLTAQVQSELFLAHVRASTGTATSRNNCHPFAVGKWSFMHNGQIGGFENFRRRADMLIPDDLYQERKGATDSEVLFLLGLTEGLQDNPREAMEIAVGILERMSRERGSTPHMRLATAFSDGETLYAIRYASDERAPTVYHKISESRSGRAVVSEPLVPAEDGWEVVPPGSFCRFHKDGSYEIEPFSPLS